MAEKNKTATIGDLCLVYIREKEAFYARIEDISPDMKPNWYHVAFLALTFPPQLVTWILREPQWNGEPFTMDGTPMKIVKVVSPYIPPAPDKKEKTKPSGASSEKVISLAERKKRT